MRILKMAVIIMLAAGFLCTKVFAEKFAKDNLQFCVDRGKIYFFQPKTGRIFVYPTTTNRLSRILTLEKLGEDLTQSRSLTPRRLTPGRRVR